MEESVRKKIEEIMAGMTCPKAFRCAESGFEVLCRARDVGHEGYLECLEKRETMCTFALSFGHGRYCQCPLRVYLAKKLKK